MFNVSDKVVCVDDAPRAGSISGEWIFPSGFVKKGAIYCISEMRQECFQHGTEWRVHITGVPAIWVRDGNAYGWCADRFRKLSEVQAENELARTLTNFSAHSNRQTSAR